MKSIKISKSGGNTNFTVHETGWKTLFIDELSSIHSCDCCGISLNLLYVYLMKKFKKLGLIERDHYLLCCRCKNIIDKRKKILDAMTGK